MSDRIAVMHHGRLLQIGSAEELYERPVNRFVADFIGQTNLIEATVADGDMVVLGNGSKVLAPTDFPTGTPVAMSLRPEAISIGRRGSVPAEHRADSLDGVVATAVYLGHAVDYHVSVDWIDLEVRAPAVASQRRFRPGDEVSIWWDRSSNWVVAD